MASYLVSKLHLRLLCSLLAVQQISAEYLPHQKSVAMADLNVIKPEKGRTFWIGDQDLEIEWNHPIDFDNPRTSHQNLSLWRSFDEDSPNARYEKVLHITSGFSFVQKYAGPRTSCRFHSVLQLPKPRTPESLGLDTSKYMWRTSGWPDERKNPFEEGDLSTPMWATLESLQYL